VIHDRLSCTFDATGTFVGNSNRICASLLEESDTSVMRCKPAFASLFTPSSVAEKRYRRARQTLAGRANSCSLMLVRRVTTRAGKLLARD
jgi:hypothetical protein